MTSPSRPALRPVQLDRIDLAILTILQKNGRLSNTKLSAQVGLTVGPCLRRVQRLYHQGYIRSFHAKIDLAKFGQEHLAFAAVELKTQRDAELLHFAEQCGRWALVRECSTVSGGSDFILKCVSAREDEMDYFFRVTLPAFPSVKEVKRFPVKRITKNEPCVQLTHEALSIKIEVAST